MSNLQDFVIENSVLSEYLGEDKEVVIPNHVTQIGNCAFYNCTSLQSITIPDGVTEIGERAFEGCKKLTIYAPAEGTVKEYAKKRRIPFEELK